MEEMYSYHLSVRRCRSGDARPPDDVLAAYAAHLRGSPAMTLDGLKMFLAGPQGESPEDVDRIADIAGGFRSFAAPGGSAIRDVGMGIDEFFGILFSEELNPPIRSLALVHHDMTAPLSHYFIFTGHNSYLTGNQLSSACSDAPIKQALEIGVRVIELDMWPNSSKDNIDILHGRTLTSPVELIKCLRTIKENAFISTSYPLILTLEDHLTPDLQAKAAEMITETFGDLLYRPDSDTVTDFPSPEHLKKKIIISTKPPTEYLESKKKEQDSDEQDDDELDDESDEDDLQPNSNDQYRKLIAIHAGKPKGGIKEALSVDPNKVRRLSLSESQLTNATESYSTDLVRFTQKNLLRIYPKGTRFNSSNYKPFVGWMHGAQMVAFNMQGHDKALWSMKGFFRANGRCGYIKKPEYLLKTGPDDLVFDPMASLPVMRTLKVKVYLGDGWKMDFSSRHFDTFSPPDFYVKIGIAGVPSDCVMEKTKPVEDEWAPFWDEEFTFPLTVPELAVLRVEVKDYDSGKKHDFGGQTCLPVSELRPGIRSVPLYDRKGVKYKSTRLLMRFEFE